ncbi:MULTISPECIES: hypothetical protein [Flavobacterium]|uniref:DUF58 domain-containing protein n=1 Tax=Flavobacterium jumunjinense TaxID=998845 RepID=A0ABV5GTX2_9FLAO|nr:MULTISPECIES: hypothetical protein [Flavobacterium]
MSKKNLFNNLSSLFSGKFAFFGSLASILGLLVLIANDNFSIIIALSFFCLMLFIFTSYLVYNLYKVLNTKQTDHANRSTFIKYENIDGNKIFYETYKLIQVKKPVLTEMEYHFKWTGTHMPVVTSNLQNVINIVDEQNPLKYDRALLKFKKPVYFNQNLVLHFKAELDDVDKVSLSHVETRVVSEIDIIHYRIILKNKSPEFCQNANLEKRKIDSDVSATFDKIREIPFDRNTKSYEYHLLNPEIGFYYRISWEK